VVNWPSSREDLQRLREALQYRSQPGAPGEPQQPPAWDPAAAAAQEQLGAAHLEAPAPGSGKGPGLDQAAARAALAGGLGQDAEEAGDAGEESLLLESLLQGLAVSGGEAAAPAAAAAAAAAADGAGLLDTGKRKDANEVLLREGPEALLLLVAGASPFPVKGLYRWGPRWPWGLALRA
jgi:hypothetical protein